MFDVIVIGGGVVGGLLLRELTKYRLNVCMVEKENDVAMGQSKANSGIVHAGYDAKNGTNKAKFNLLGNKMMSEVCKELGVKYKNNGSLVVAFSEEEKTALLELKERGEKNGVQGLEILTADKLFSLEPNISKEAVAALYAPTGGIVCPYSLTVAAVGNAMDNGASLYLNFEVVHIEKADEGVQVKAKDGRILTAKTVFNCAALQSGEIAKTCGDDIQMGGRKGEYLLLDKESGGFLSHTLFFAPTKMGKGILLTPTVDGNLLVGPTAEEIEDGNRETSRAGIENITQKAKKMCPAVPLYNTITSFAGVRAYSSKHDFILTESERIQGVFHLAGIESPGLTAAPAIAKYAVEELLSKRLPLVKNQAFHPYRAPDYFFAALSDEEKNELIKKDPTYGKIVCRCEQITEGEIRRAVRENPKATDIDGIKRRTRTGMGRCQGGFCQPQVAEIIADELGIELEKVTKKGKGSYLLKGVTK